MPRHDREHDDRVDTGFALSVSALTAVIALLIFAVISSLMVMGVEALRPRVGDMIVFKPGWHDTDSWRTEIVALGLEGPSRVLGECKLNPATLAQEGGSLVIEARHTGEETLYRVHWAGKRTTTGAGNCGADADLLLSPGDVQRLAGAAGGFGVKNKGVFW